MISLAVDILFKTEPSSHWHHVQLCMYLCVETCRFLFVFKPEVIDVNGILEMSSSLSFNLNPNSTFICPV